MAPSLLLNLISSFAVAYIFAVIADVDTITIVPVDVAIVVAAVVIFIAIVYVWWLSSLLLNKVRSFAVAYIIDVVADVDIFAVVSTVAAIVNAAVFILFATVYVLMALYSAARHGKFFCCCLYF